MLVAGRYRTADRLGRGGMGEVWRAVDEVLGRPVAVKLLLGRGNDAATLDRFQLEARTAARLSDPHVVSVYDVGSCEDRLYLVMELLEGRSLAEELSAHGPFSPGRAARIGGQTAAGLAAAHRQGVVHRDVKPANLLLDSEGDVKIGDFGIARFADESAAVPATPGQIIGTTPYLAPERALGQPAGGPADMYGLGCVLYELLVGRPPFLAESPAGVAYQHVDAVPDPPSLHRSDVPEPFDALVLGLLAKDPLERPTAEQAAQLLDNPDLFAPPEPPAHYLPGLAARSVRRRGLGMAALTGPGTAAPAVRPRSRKLRVLAGTFVATVAAATFVTLSANSPGAGDERPPVTTQTRLPSVQNVDRPGHLPEQLRNP
ncbi:serine/threonine-protein kinase [Streptomyces sp. NPDC088725]|uniref:serine/threonine-protein kinase n=1 Tax=Streptomyces sp. NPDC088725 TaxID=3365873 RepID=UPI003803AF73